MTDAIQIQIRPTAAAFPALRARGTWTRRDWRTVAHADAQTIERTRLALQQTAPDHLYEYRAIRANPPAHLHIPATVAQLGSVLDLTTQIDATRTTWEIADLAGMVLTTDADAMDRRPGHAALYLLRTQAQHRTPNAGKQHRIDLKQAMQRIHAFLYPDEALEVRDAIRAGRYEFIRSIQRQTQGRFSAPGAPPPPSAEDWQALINEATDQAHKRRQQNPPNASAETLWTDLGMEDSSSKDRAEVWRQELFTALDDLEAGGYLSWELYPLLPDLDADPRLVATYKRANDERRELTTEEAYQHGFDFELFQAQLRDQIEDASDAQIIAYGNAYYDLADGAPQTNGRASNAGKQHRIDSRNDEAQAEAGATYAEWHEREPEQVTHADDLPDVIGIYIGRALRIGYRSDKWHERGQTEDYDHDYTEQGYEPPEVWADHADLARARAIVIVGGNQRITADGID